MSTFQNLTLESAVVQLKSLKDRRIDLVAPIKDMFIHHDGTFVVDQPGGVTINSTPNNVAHEHISAKFGIPRKYWRKCYEELPRLAAAQVNQWIQFEMAKEKHRSMFFRAYKNEGQKDTMRALLSNSYLPYDNYLLLGVVMDAVQQFSKQTDLEIKVKSCDISEKRMYVRFECPSIEQDIKAELGNYSDPHTVKAVRENGVVAGFTITNSEVGFGKLAVAPIVIVKACNNGMVWYDESYNRRHLGGRMDDGIYKEDTQKANFGLIGKQVRDHIEKFLHPDFLNQSVNYIKETASIQMKNPYEQAQLFTNELSLNDDETSEFFNCLLNQGQMGTGFDMIQALTSTAKKFGPDRKWELECKSTDLIKTLNKVSKFSAN